MNIGGVLNAIPWYGGKPLNAGSQGSAPPQGGPLPDTVNLQVHFGTVYNNLPESSLVTLVPGTQDISLLLPLDGTTITIEQIAFSGDSYSILTPNILNGYPGFLAPNTDNPQFYRVMTAPFSASEMTFFFVARITDKLLGDGFASISSSFLSGINSPGISFNRSENADSFVVDRGLFSPVPPTAPSFGALVTDWHLYALVYSPATGTLETWRDGAQIDTYTGTLPPVFTFNILTFNNQGGELMEYIIYDTIKTPLELSVIFQYLSAKYNLPLLP